MLCDSMLCNTRAAAVVCCDVHSQSAHVRRRSGKQSQSFGLCQVDMYVFGELIYSDHLMLFTDQHSLGPKTTERVRVAEIESFASSNDNNGEQALRRLIKLAYCLSRRHEMVV